MRMVIFTLKDSFFHTEPLVIAGCTSQHLEQYLRKKYKWNVDVDSDVEGTVLRRYSAPYRVVWFKKVPRNDDGWGTVVHELFHLVVRICNDKQIPIKAEIESGECGDEAAAYILEGFFIQCREKFRSRKK